MAAFRIVDLLYVELEVDCADDAIAEFLMYQRLERRAIDLHHLVEPGEYADANAKSPALKKKRRQVKSKA